MKNKENAAQNFEELYVVFCDEMILWKNDLNKYNFVTGSIREGGDITLQIMLVPKVLWLKTLDTFIKS